MDAFETFELFFECRGLDIRYQISNTSSYLVVNLDELEFETEEVKENANPKYSSSMKVNYYFETTQIIKFLVYNNKKSKTIIGSYECPLSTIFCKILKRFFFFKF